MKWQRMAVLVGAAAVLGMAAAGPGTAAAQVRGSRFVFESCDSQLPGGAVPASEHGYSGAFSAFQNCAAPGGAIGLVESAPASATFGALWVSIPATPGGFVETETITAVKSGIDAANALHDSHINVNGFPGPAAEETRIFPLRSEPKFLGWNGGLLEIYMSCDGNVGPCGAGPVLGAHYIAATEVDPNPPSVGALSGSALSGAVLRGHQTLGAEAADVGGGLTNLSVLVNGLVAAPAVSGPCATAQVSNRSTYGTVAYSPTPCPPKLKGDWTLDTAAYPFHDGANTVAVCASDFATLGNPSTTCSPAQTVTVDNSCTESEVPGGSQIAAGFAQTNTETVTVGYGAAAEVDGSLRDGAGDPVAGATICVKAQTLESGLPQAPVAAVKTDAEGRFAYAVPAGPDREVMLGYRHDSFQIARQVRYFAHTEPSLEVDPPKLRNGGHIHLWGTLPGPAAEGRVVILQANVKGSRRWITFRRATTDGTGRFKSGYRFRSTSRRTIYRFRAIVPRQDHYPYVEGHSKPVHVVVRPHRRRHRRGKDGRRHHDRNDHHRHDHRRSK